MEVFLRQPTSIKRVHNFTVHLVCRLLTVFLIASKVLLISLLYVIFHMLEVFVFASFLCDIEYFEYLKFEKKLNQMEIKH